MLGFYDDMLWQAFYAVSLAPSYLNRQPYGFLVRDHEIIFVQISDPYTDGTDAGLDAGIALLHFAAVAAQLLGKGRWELDPRESRVFQRAAVHWHAIGCNCNEGKRKAGRSAMTSGINSRRTSQHAHPDHPYRHYEY